MRYWDNGHMDGGWGVFMVLSMVLFWVLVVLAVAWFVRSTRPTQPPPPPPPSGSVTGSAESILAERLARGEIEPEDYRARLEALRTSKG